MLVVGKVQGAAGWEVAAQLCEARLLAAAFRQQRQAPALTPG